MNMILFKNGMENEHFYIFEHRACVWSELCIVIASCIFFFLINTYYLNSATQ